VTATRHGHFVEVAREPTPRERETLDRLLRYGPAAPEAERLRGRMLLVTPRLGTISPWSSKATDIARQCGLEALVRRIERGTAFFLEGDLGGLPAALPALHDRMTEAVLASLDEADRLFRHIPPPQALASIDVLGRGRAAIDEANAAMGLALAPDESRLPLPKACAGPIPGEAPRHHLGKSRKTGRFCRPLLPPGSPLSPR
jgi:phosphoribosylformylglycinamidine synthase